MALQPSRPGFMFAGALVFLVLPFLWARFTGQRVNTSFVIVGIAIALVFVLLAIRYRRQLRARADVPPST
jgi:LPXTG-motif cell wall-anchored protein